MQHTEKNDPWHRRHRGRTSQQQKIRMLLEGAPASWWRSPLAGYLLSLAFVAAAFLIPRLEAVVHIHDYFMATPFVIGTFLVGWIWGVGPALLSLIVGVLCVDYWLIPPIYVLTFYQWPDLASFIPFIGLQLLILYLIAQQKRSQAQLRMAQREASSRAEELAESNQALAQSNTRLHEAHQLKDQFLSMASHELRTPVAGIQGHIQLLLRRIEKRGAHLPEGLPMRDALTTVEQQTKRLTDLVNDLFDLNSLRSGKVPLDLSPCDVNAICADVVREQQLLSQRPMTLLHAVVSPPILADVARLHQVLTNLISNAVKYSPPGSEIIVRVASDQQEACISVQDHGKGIPAQHLQSLFEPFYRTPDARSSPISGTGLGLSICRDIVTRHGGRIWCESEPESGSTFVVALPLAPQLGSQAPCRHADPGPLL